MPDTTRLSFYTGANYMKRLDVGSTYQDITLGSNASGNVSVAHNLGYIPDYETSAELLADGMIWKNNIPYVGMENNNSTYIETEEWIDGSNLTVHVMNNTGGTLTIRVHYTIYKDYGNV